MQVILLTDVKNVGKKGDTVTLKDGYARNLISKKQAGEVNARTMNDLKLQKQHEEKVAEKRLEDAKKLCEKLRGATVTLPVKVGKDGKLFGSVSTKEIADECSRAFGIEFDKKKLVLPEPLKEIGEFEIPVKLHPEVTGSIRVKVIGE